MGNVRIFSDKLQFIINKGLLVMDVSVTDKLQYPGCLFIVGKGNLQFVIHVTKTFDAGIFSNGNLSSCFNNFRLPSSQFFKIIKFIITPVLERTVGVDARFMGKCIGPKPRLV